MAAPPLARASGQARRSGVVATLFFLLLWLPAVTLAEVAPAAGSVPDVRLLVDCSSSMTVSDPDNLRAPSLELIVRLLPEGARAGVWCFGQGVEELVPLQVIDAQWRKAAAEAIAAISYAGQRTDIPAALAAAIPDPGQMEPAYRTSVILLTDGTVDVSESPMANASAARRVLTTVAPALRAAGIPVHTIALSDEADWLFLRSLAQATGGIAEKAATAGELPAIFLQALEMVAPMPRAPIAGNRFQIDDSVQALTALVIFSDSNGPVALVDPAGNRIMPGSSGPDVEWVRNRRFTLVTVTGPVAGNWQLEAPAASATRVMVTSELQLDVGHLPASFPAGRQAELGLRLREGGATITDPEVLARLPILVEVERPRGDSVVIDVSATYPLSANGEYRVLLPGFDEPGRYRLLVRLSAGTVQRELPLYVEVEPTPATSTIVTRGTDVAQQDLRLPLLAAGLVLSIVLLALWWILRRRRRRRLELWERRGRPDGGSAAGSGPGAVAGDGAGPAETRG